MFEDGAEKAVVERVESNRIDFINGGIIMDFLNTRNSEWRMGPPDPNYDL